MLYHTQNLEITLTFKKRHRTQSTFSALDKPYLPINQHAVLDPMLCGCVRLFVSSGDFSPTKMDPDQARQRDFYWIQTDGISHIIDVVYMLIVDSFSFLHFLCHYSEWPCCISFMFIFTRIMCDCVFDVVIVSTHLCDCANVELHQSDYSVSRLYVTPVFLF